MCDLRVPNICTCWAALLRSFWWMPLTGSRMAVACADQARAAGDSRGCVLFRGQAPAAAAVLHPPGLLLPAQGRGATRAESPGHCPAGGDQGLPGARTPYRQAPEVPDGQALSSRSCCTGISFLNYALGMYLCLLAGALKRTILPVPRHSIAAQFKEGAHYLGSLCGTL